MTSLNKDEEWYIKLFREEYIKYYNGILERKMLENGNPWFESLLHKLAHKIKEDTEVKERMRSFEILHKYALKTRTTEALDLIESAQKEILSPQSEELTN